MVAAVCTSATQIGSVVSEVISQAAATSFIHMQMLAASQVTHSIRKTGVFSGAKAEGSCCAPAALGAWGGRWGSGGMGSVTVPAVPALGAWPASRSV
jgi:hypothetical protein